ncbi:MAG: hypothetical protein FMLXV2_gp4 [Fushun monolepta lauta xinmovirus 2]|uniref:Uncharacterized protein n=1 Tax=Fushun monolepta lauta xinmovirus 2 TaxID=2905555 RepID=A0A8K1XZ75_9MONO|nr:MAG: hypothetical protein FMLXV2_gp4 [Fushun monolepta lauta xinmovirus 2]
MASILLQVFLLYTVISATISMKANDHKGSSTTLLLSTRDRLYRVRQQETVFVETTLPNRMTLQTNHQKANLSIELRYNQIFHEDYHYCDFVEKRAHTTSCVGARGCTKKYCKSQYKNSKGNPLLGDMWEDSLKYISGCIFDRGCENTCKRSNRGACKWETLELVPTRCKTAFTQGTTSEEALITVETVNGKRIYYEVPINTGVADFVWGRIRVLRYIREDIYQPEMTLVRDNEGIFLFCMLSGKDKPSSVYRDFFQIGEYNKIKTIPNLVSHTNSCDTHYLVNQPSTLWKDSCVELGPSSFIQLNSNTVMRKILTTNYVISVENLYNEKTLNTPEGSEFVYVLWQQQ